MSIKENSRVFKDDIGKKHMKIFFDGFWVWVYRLVTGKCVERSAW